MPHSHRKATTGPGLRRRWWSCACQLALLLSLLLPGQAPAAPPIQLAVIVNPEVSVTAIGSAELAAFFTRTTRSWKDGTTVRPLNLPAGSPERIEFDRAVLAMTPEQSAQFWVDKQVRGDGAAPKSISEADIVVRLVASLAGAIAYVPEAKVDSKVRVVARIRGGKLVGP